MTAAGAAAAGNLRKNVLAEPPARRGLVADPNEHEDPEGQHQAGNEAAVDRLRDAAQQPFPDQGADDRPCRRRKQERPQGGYLPPLDDEVHGQPRPVHAQAHRRGRGDEGVLRHVEAQHRCRPDAPLVADQAAQQGQEGWARGGGGRPRRRRGAVDGGQVGQTREAPACGVAGWGPTIRGRVAGAAGSKVPSGGGVRPRDKRFSPIEVYPPCRSCRDNSSCLLARRINLSSLAAPGGFR